jgi:hypothetical protein
MVHLRCALEVAYNYGALEACTCGGMQFRRAIELDVNKEAVSNT